MEESDLLRLLAEFRASDEYKSVTTWEIDFIDARLANRCEDKKMTIRQKRKIIEILKKYEMV